MACSLSTDSLLQIPLGGGWVPEALATCLEATWWPSSTPPTTSTWSAALTSWSWRGTSGTSMRPCSLCGRRPTTATGVWIHCRTENPLNFLKLSAFRLLTRYVSLNSQVRQCGGHLGAGWASTAGVHYIWSSATGDQRHPLQEASSRLFPVKCWSGQPPPVDVSGTISHQLPSILLLDGPVGLSSE